MKTKLFCYLIALIVFIFAVSRVQVVMKEYIESSYSPISTLATLALILIAIIIVARFGVFLLGRSRLSVLVLFFNIFSIFNVILFTNPEDGIAKSLMYIAIWENRFFIY